MFAEDSAINASSKIRYGISPAYNEGWAFLDFLQGNLVATLPAGSRELADSAGTVFNGLPATGFAVFRYVNGTLEGGSVLANYAAAIDHKSEVLITP